MPQAFKLSLHSTWGSNLQPQGQEQHALLTELGQVPPGSTPDKGSVLQLPSWHLPLCNYFIFLLYPSLMEARIALVFLSAELETLAGNRHSKDHLPNKCRGRELEEKRQLHSGKALSGFTPGSAPPVPAGGCPHYPYLPTPRTLCRSRVRLWEWNAQPKVCFPGTSV